MFNKPILILLKIFDGWGFCTERPSDPKCRRKTVQIFILHILLAVTVTVSIIDFVLYTFSSNGNLHNVVNNSLHYSTALVTYWSILIESYTQRQMQRKFWEAITCIDEEFHDHTRFTLSSYLFRLIELFTIFSIIQMGIAGYFVSYTTYYPVVPYLLAYNIMIKMYQLRIFYYLFYVELINFELKAIEHEIKNTSTNSRSDYRRSPESMISPIKSIKWIRKYYCLVHLLNVCLNSIFGWSNFTTILCSFYLLLTDLNWAYDNIADQEAGYFYGRNNLSKFEFSSSSHFKCFYSVFFVAYAFGTCNLLSLQGNI